MNGAEPVTGQTNTESSTHGNSVFTPELGAEICALLAEGKSLRTVCNIDKMPDKSTVFRWLAPSNEAPGLSDFRDQYARAKEEAADAMAEDILYIADTTQVGEITVTKQNSQGDPVTETREEDMLGHRRLQIDTRKFLMAKMKPKKYGDKLDLTTGGDKIQRGMSIEEIDAVLVRAEQEAEDRAKAAAAEKAEQG